MRCNGEAACMRAWEMNAEPWRSIFEGELGRIADVSWVAMLVLRAGRCKTGSPVFPCLRALTTTGDDCRLSRSAPHHRRPQRCPHTVGYDLVSVQVSKIHPSLSALSIS